MGLINYKKTRLVAIWLYTCSLAIFFIITVNSIPTQLKIDKSIIQLLQYSWVFIIGIVYFLPFVLFLLAKRLPRIYLPSLFGFLLIGCLHWLMSIYIGLDILLFAMLFHMALKLSVEPAQDSAVLSPLYKPIRLSMLLLIIALFLGDTNLFDNYFYHQVIAILAGITILFTVLRSCNFQKIVRISRVFTAVCVLMLLQMGLGIVISMMPEQYYIALLHRGLALSLLAMLIWAWHEVPHTNYSVDKNDK